MSKTPDGKTRLWLRLMKIGELWGCHQLPQRSFFFREWQFPVCARCTGVLTGQAAALIFRRIKLPFMLPVSACLATLADWTAQELEIKGSTNSRRLITGILGGFGTGYIFIRTVMETTKYLKRRTKS